MPELTQLEGKSMCGTCRQGTAGLALDGRGIEPVLTPGQDKRQCRVPGPMPIGYALTKV